MQAPVDDHAELVIDSLRHGKPVKVISDCRCNAVELPFPHNQWCSQYNQCIIRQYISYQRKNMLLISVLR